MFWPFRKKIQKGDYVWSKAGGNTLAKVLHADKYGGIFCKVIDTDHPFIAQREKRFLNKDRCSLAFRKGKKRGE